MNIQTVVSYKTKARGQRMELVKEFRGKKDKMWWDVDLGCLGKVGELDS